MRGLVQKEFMGLGRKKVITARPRSIGKSVKIIGRVCKEGRYRERGLLLMLVGPLVVSSQDREKHSASSRDWGDGLGGVGKAFDTLFLKAELTLDKFTKWGVCHNILTSNRVRYDYELPVYHWFIHI